MHAVNATLLAQKPLLVVKYREYQGEKEDGNRMLISKGAIELRAKKEDITDNPDQFISIISGKQQSVSETANENFKDTLF